jgi:phage FluMu protein Com
VIILGLELSKVRCPYCGKVLLESAGEVKKICPKCKKMVHIVATSKGIIDLDRFNS